MKPTKCVKAWKFLMDCCDKVKDPVLASAMREEFRQRALREWGWCPEAPTRVKQVPLEDWEEEFVRGVKAAQTFGVIPDGFSKIKETKARMYMMMEEGKTYWDIPQDIQSDFLRKLWIEVENDWLANNLANVKNSPQDARKQKSGVVIPEKRKNVL